MSNRLVALFAVAPLAFASAAEANIAYLRSTTGKPWGLNGNENAMSSVFGAWDDLRYELVNPNDVFNASRAFVFMEGGDSTANEMETFFDANQALIEGWVASGGRLLINSAPNEGNGMNYGFGGVSLKYWDGSFWGYAVDMNHAVYTGPYGSPGAALLGDYFAHSSVSGGGAKPITTGDFGQTLLSELDWGSGHVVFGGLTLPFFWDHPLWTQPDSQDYLQNLIFYASGNIPAPGSAVLLGIAGLVATRRRR
jgi:hypothetical protein